MIHPVSRRLTHGLLAAALLAVACKPAKRADATDSAAAADSSSATEQQPSAATPAADAAGATTSQSSATAPLTAEDVDRWQRGMQGELAAVQDAEKQLASAKTSNDTLNAMSAALETSTLAAGAKAAGVDEERYKVIRGTLSPLAGDMAPIENEMNVKDMAPAMVAQLKQGREQSLAQASAGIPQPVLDALRPRAAELRKQDLALTAARLKAAGAAR